MIGGWRALIGGLYGTLAAAGSALLALSACGDEARSGPAPAFPTDYAASYIEVRDCRTSSDHELNRVRVLADPAAAVVYQSRNGEFAEGAIVLKEEHDFADIDCTGEVKRWTVMIHQAAGTSGDTLGWYWQDIDAQRRVNTADEPRCINCHTSCGQPPDGFQGTCTVP